MHAVSQRSSENRDSDCNTTDRPRGRTGCTGTVLVVDPDLHSRRTLAQAVASTGAQILECASAESARAKLRDIRIDLVISDARLPGSSGIELLEFVRNGWPETRRVLVAERVDLLESCDLINRAGVSQLLAKPFEESALETLRCEIIESSRGQSSVASRGEQFGLIGNSAAIRGLIDLVERIAPTDSTVLISGETGTGKELVGQAIHQASHRHNQVFSAINSAALPETLLESELFGHRRGAFTGASSNRKGLFEYADGGTVFLDELGEMPLSMQVKLLRFLQTGELRPIGGETSRSVDVRLVSATNRDLDDEVAAGRFREDLYYRLAVIPITVPPLRERLDDVPLLASHFLRATASKFDGREAVIDDSAMEVLLRHNWPGNVRELQNVIEHGVALCSKGCIRVTDLPRRLLVPEKHDVTDIQSLPGVERRHILETLEKVDWNRKRAASLLKISTTTLWRRLKEFGIEERRSGNTIERSVTSNL